MIWNGGTLNRRPPAAGQFERAVCVSSHSWLLTHGGEGDTDIPIWLVELKATKLKCTSEVSRIFLSCDCNVVQSSEKSS